MGQQHGGSLPRPTMKGRNGPGSDRWRMMTRKGVAVNAEWAAEPFFDNESVGDILGSTAKFAHFRMR